MFVDVFKLICLSRAKGFWLVIEGNSYLLVLVMLSGVLLSV